MSNEYTPDDALRDWAADAVNRDGRYKQITELTASEISTVMFGSVIDCYSSYTCEYGLDATVNLVDGSRLVLDYITWNDALSGIREYIEAERVLDREHAMSHDRIAYE